MRSSRAKKFGVGTDLIIWAGDRIGVIYTERGASQRPSKVIYDRKNTSIATAKPGAFDWEKIFEKADRFHFTGITPALGEGTAELCMEACKAAQTRNIFITLYIRNTAIQTEGNSFRQCEKSGEHINGFPHFFVVPGEFSVFNVY